MWIYGHSVLWPNIKHLISGCLILWWLVLHLTVIWSNVLPDRDNARLTNTFPRFVEWEMSLLCLQNPAARHHPEIPNPNLAWARWVQSRSSRYNLVKFILILFSHTHKSSMLFFRSAFLIQILELFLLSVFCSCLPLHLMSIRKSAEQQNLQSRIAKIK